ncbi:ARM repeat superfamily protein [Actinidia rufa]|uniref:RING-type E3 ubiquitin transferase n=1 Tax=Actinidia rufa TaxID=165716 RepID=A0A7J0EXB5_9ERIC|nr:ARM repeat superfamily protein [Actinidia rufa]
MVSKPDMSTRRILTFPAIRHCEAVSTATLLDSLLLLASNIFEYKSKPLFTNYRNAQQSLRLIGVLSIFFEEIRENRSDFSDSSVLSFSELHFILQKLRFLLEDFTCDGARLWTLMKCDFVASLFRVLIRAIATALDVLPLRSIEVSLEARESVQLVMKQARELQFEVDPADRFVSNDVISILSQFGDGIVPDSSDLRRVLYQLGIKSWSECNREIKLLESEMGFEYLSEEKRDLGLLSSLIGLMSYCRVVLFEFIDTLPTQQPNDSSSEVIRHLNTYDFQCPISLELMTDPVIVQTGHTYDRSSILKWFKAGNPTCPKTGERLKKHRFGPKFGSEAADFAILLSCLAESGAIPRLLNLLPSTNPLAQENALAGLLNLSKHSKSKTIIVENGGVELILGVLKEGLRMEAQQHAAGTLFYLASVEEYRVLIGEIPGAIQALMDLIRNGSDRCKKNALVAIFGLLMYSDNHWRVLSAGLVPLLVNLLTSLESEELIVDSLAVLATIAEKQDGTMAILRAKALPVVVEILNSTTSRAGKDYCVSLLLALCLNGEGDVVPVLVKNPSLMAPLYALLTEGTSRSSKKAGLLIRLLHEFHERSSSNLMSPDFSPRTICSCVVMCKLFHSSVLSKHPFL